MAKISETVYYFDRPSRDGSWLVFVRARGIWRTREIDPGEAFYKKLLRKLEHILNLGILVSHSGDFRRIKVATMKRPRLP